MRLIHTPEPYTLNITIGDGAAIHHLMHALGKSEKEVLAAIEKGGGDIERVVRALGCKLH